MPEIDYAQIVRRSPDAIIVADPEGRIIVWNHAAERLWGHTADAALGETLDLIIPEAFRERHWTGFDHALETGETKYDGQWLPTRSMRADGSSFYVELGFAVLRDGSGVVTSVLATARDITERFEHDRNERRRVRELEAELQQLKEAAPAD